MKKTAARSEELNRRVGATVRRKREAKNWSQERLGKEASLSRTSIAYIERGDQEVGIETFVRLVQALDERPDEFLREVLSEPHSNEAWVTKILSHAS